ncbi:MAG: hypothetical protein IOD08_18590 [Bradyrhizobium sp.]|uniref:hypothetical protein n=1 Tax=Bradyrhizobium sp. TaxID=376 RepID=UPI0025C53328|nr:hypothetical protein [Bradyrhizobium sp.]MCA3579287.1 hypothetical protein [Bradyrhizobium sp.]
MRVIVVSLAVAALAAPLSAQTLAASRAPRTPMVPAEVKMRTMTPAEANAHRLWSLRAALNVAALQCQFSPFLRTVANYNEMLPMHAAELDVARRTLEGHFRRLDKGAAQRTFDQYTTRTYNSFSTLDAQVAFCEEASRIGQGALGAARGQLGAFASARLAEIRASLTPAADPLKRVELGWVYIPPIGDPCIDARGRRIKRC